MTDADREKALQAHLPDGTVDEHTAFRSGWNSALLAAGASEGKSPRACKCTMAQRMVGDGCDVCNPELAAELSEGQASDARDAERWRMAVALCYMPQTWREHVEEAIEQERRNG